MRIKAFSFPSISTLCWFNPEECFEPMKCGRLWWGGRRKRGCKDDFAIKCLHSRYLQSSRECEEKTPYINSYNKLDFDKYKREAHQNTGKIWRVGCEKPHPFMGESGRWTEMGDLWHRHLRLDKTLIDVKDSINKDTEARKYRVYLRNNK